jgi:hypothetical protein
MKQAKPSPKLPARATPGKLIKMPGRKDGIKSDINVRFLTERDYRRVVAAAKVLGVSTNLFITQAALEAARDGSIEIPLKALARPKPAPRRA